MHDKGSLKNSCRAFPVYTICVAVGNIWNSFIFIVYFIVSIRHTICLEKRKSKKTKFELFGVQKAEQNVPKITVHFPLPLLLLRREVLMAFLSCAVNACLLNPKHGLFYLVSVLNQTLTRCGLSLFHQAVKQKERRKNWWKWKIFACCIKLSVNTSWYLWIKLFLPTQFGWALKKNCFWGWFPPTPTPTPPPVAAVIAETQKTEMMGPKLVLGTERTMVWPYKHYRF